MLYDVEAEVRRRTASCIGWLNQEELAVELIPLLNDTGVEVRRSAVEAMGNLGFRQVVSDLIEHLDDPEAVVRKAIISALKSITGKKMGGSFQCMTRTMKLSARPGWKNYSSGKKGEW